MAAGITYALVPDKYLYCTRASSLSLPFPPLTSQIMRALRVSIAIILSSLYNSDGAGVLAVAVCCSRYNALSRKDRYRSFGISSADRFITLCSISHEMSVTGIILYMGI